MPQNDQGKTPNSPPTPQAGSGTNVGTTSPMQLVMALNGVNPMETMEALRASLPPSVNSSLQMDMTTVNSESKFIGWRLLRRVDAQDLSQALTLVKQSLMPMSRLECLKLLTETFIRTAPRAQTTDDLKLRLAVYESDLSEYPADIVRYALREWPKHNVFWPVTKELLDMIGPWNWRRKSMMVALEKALVKAE